MVMGDEYFRFLIKKKALYVYYIFKSVREINVCWLADNRNINFGKKKRHENEYLMDF